MANRRNHRHVLDLATGHGLEHVVGHDQHAAQVQQTAQQAAAAAGRLLPVSLGAEGTAEIGGIISTGYKEVTFDGLQATPGTGTVAIGDYVVTGTVVAKGTALTGQLKVTKATSQTPGAYKARVVSLGQAGTGAVGTVGTVELF